MTRDELLYQWTDVCRENGVPVTVRSAHTALCRLCDIISAELVRGGRVVLPEIGVLVPTCTRACVLRNPRTGADMAVPPRRTVRFRQSKILKERLCNRRKGV